MLSSRRCWYYRAAKTPEKASEGEKPAERKDITALAIADPDVSDDNSIDLSTYRDSVEQVKAIAAKISTARRLARKLAEEKAAVSAIKDGDSREAELCDIVTCLPCMRQLACPSSRSSAVHRVQFILLQPNPQLCTKQYIMHVLLAG